MIGKKRAQITIFTIVGIIILIGAVAYFVIRGQIVPRPIKELPTEVLTEEEASVRDYVESCLRPNVLEGLEIQRLQGGFIDIPIGVETLTVKDPENRVVKDINGKKQVVIDANSAGNAVPYWLIGDKINIPMLKKMEDDLGEYVLTNFLDCVGDFSAFKEQGYEVELGVAEINITMANAVIVDLKYPINLRKGETEVKQEEFIVSIPINMKEAYQTAVELAAFEGIYNYLEDHIISLISLYSYAGGDKTASTLPPFAHYEYSFSGCNYKSWSKKDVETQLKESMYSNIPYLKFANTKFDNIVRSDPVEQGVFDSFVYNFFSEDKSNIRIDLSYDYSWQINFDIAPRSGDAIKPDLFKGIEIKGLAGFCRMKYYFKYDIKLPVLFKVYELNSAKIDPIGNVYETRAGYGLQFLMQAFLCGNQKRRCTVSPVFITNLQRLASFDAATYQLFTALPKTYFCDDNQKISGDITIRVINKDTNEPVSDASVSYFCGSRENNCLIGNTNENGILVSKFPYCVNGEIVATKGGFEDSRKRITIESPNMNSYTLELNPFRELILDVKKVYVDNLLKNYYMTNGFTADRCTGEPIADIESYLQPLNPLVSDQVMISTADGNVFAIYPPDETIEIGAGDYRFELATQQQVTIRPAEFNNSRYGGANTHTSVFSLDVDVNSVKDFSKITFYAPIEFLSGSVIDAFELAEPVLNANGSISNKVEIEDCDGTIKTIEVTMPKEKAEEILKPRLE